MDAVPKKTNEIRSFCPLSQSELKVKKQMDFIIAQLKGDLILDKKSFGRLV